MIRLMWDGDTLAGHYALSPVRLRIEGDLVMSGLSMTTMTHPHYACRGIFSQLAKELYWAEYQDNSLAAVWGFPNANSHYGFIRNLGWQNVAVLPTFRIDVARVREVEVVRTKICNEFSLMHEQAYGWITSAFPVRVEKTAEYLSWRYLRNPSNKYVILSLPDVSNREWFAVVKLFPSTRKECFEVDLVELCYPPDGLLLLDLFNAIKKIFSSLILTAINCWMPLDDERHLAMEKIGFNLSGPITYFGVQILNKEYEILREEKRWSYSMGDSDVF